MAVYAIIGTTHGSQIFVIDDKETGYE